MAGIRTYDLAEQDSGRSWHENNNAPFIAAYESNLSFHQYQVLRAFRDAHTSPSKQPPDASLHSETIGHVASVYENTFLGNDGIQLLPPEQREGAKLGLPADRFLETLAARCLCRYVPERWLSPESPLHSYLQGALRHPKALLSELCQALFSGDLSQPALFTQWLRLQKSSTLEQTSSPWANACLAIRGQTPGRASYRPFLDSPIKQPMLLVLMALMSVRDSMERLRLPSGDELLARAGALSASDVTSPEEGRLAGYLLAPAEREKGTRALFATANVDRFLFGDTSSSRLVTQDGILPDYSIVIGLGRGNIGAFRRQIWFEVQLPSIEAAAHDDKNAETPSVGAVSKTAEAHAPDTAKASLKIRAVREIYVVGDLAAIRGGNSYSIGIKDAQENLKMLAKLPETFFGPTDGWRRYCRELI